MFTSTPELVHLGTRMLRILAVGYIAMAVTQTLSGVLRGAGDTMSPMWISVITTVIIRMPLAYLLAWVTGSPDSIFISLLIAWISGAVITSIVYRRGRWRDKAALTAAAMGE